MRPTGGSARAGGRLPRDSARQLLDSSDLTIDELVQRSVDPVRR